MKFFFAPLLLLVGCSGAPFTLAEQQAALEASPEAQAPLSEAGATPDSSSEAAPADAPPLPLDVDAGAASANEAGEAAADNSPGPQTCAELGVTTDGVYELYYQGDRAKPWRVYCAGGKEYLPLPGPETNFSRDFEGVTTSYSRVRFIVDLTEVDVSDERFAVTIGTVNSSGVPVTMAYATAASGNAAPSGTGMVDLTGTGFAVAPGAFVLGGFNPQGAATYSSSSQVVTLTGGGFGGWNGPVGLSNPFVATVAMGFLKLQWAK